ncbi:MAG TPA: hypothetical protein VFA66_09985 [Gaiellaceae bacterium]|nr:hypothetical protein [Gaiellaceae bacterium]
MKIGKPQRTYRVEPIETPVPRRARPSEPIAPKPREPARVPAR